MFSARSWSLGFALVAGLGTLAAGPAMADWGHHHHGWHGRWHDDGWYRWGPPAVVVAPRAYYYAPPPPVVYAPPPVYYAAPPAYYPPGVSFGVTFH